MATTEQQDYMPALLVHLQQTGGGEPALELLARAADEHPRDPRPLLLLAAEQMHLQQVDRAEAAYLLALQRAPEYAIARFQLGLLQFTSARPAAAMATWAPLEALPETEPLVRFKRGLEALAQDRFEEARNWLVSGIDANRVNEPLNRDMQMVIERMIQSGVLNAPDAPQAGTVGEHFLVNAYGRKS